MNRTAVAKPGQIEVRKDGNVTVVMPEGPRLDAEVAGDLRTMLLQLIEGGDRRLILDLPGVTFIDSSGLGALVSALKRIKQVDPTGDIRLAHVQPSVMAVLEIIRLHRVFSQFPSVDAAVSSFRATV